MAQFSTFQIHDTGDPVIDRAFKSLEEVIRRMQLPFSEGRQIDGVAITGGARKRVAHGLGRPVRGWFVVRNNADATVYDEQDSNNFPGRELWLQASATTTVSIWVY